MKDNVFIVKKEHRTKYPDPLIFHEGDKVLLGKECTDDPSWKNWMWCQEIGSRDAGWVPI